MDASKLFASSVVGFLLIAAGVSGKIGSMLGALIAPGDMVEEQTTNTASSLPGASPSGATTGSTTTLSATQIAGYARGAGFAGNDLNIAIAVAEAESGGKVGAYNPGGSGDVENSCGLWQINVLAHPQYDRNKLLNDAAYNAKAAFAVWKGSGWNAWGAYSNGSYLVYMPVAISAALI